MDKFTYSTASFGMDQIVDFEDGTDKTMLTASGLSFGSFAVSQQSKNVLLTLKSDSSNSILLSGISDASLIQMMTLLSLK